MIEVQKNNPLHGVKLEVLLTELVEHYGWETLASTLKFNCFKSNPSITSSLKFFRKTLWAREKLEVFYLYKFKRLPKPDDEQYDLPPRDRTVPLDQKPRTPAVLTPGNSEPRPKHRTKPGPRTEPSRDTSNYEPKQTTKAWSGWGKKSENEDKESE
mgnify:CR=1 FL=1